MNVETGLIIGNLPSDSTRTVTPMGIRENISTLAEVLYETKQKQVEEYGAMQAEIALLTRENAALINSIRGECKYCLYLKEDLGTETSTCYTCRHFSGDPPVCACGCVSYWTFDVERFYKDGAE